MAPHVAALTVQLLLFVVTEDWYFCSHRLPLAVAARAAGYDVAVATRVTEHRDVITKAGVRVIPFENARGSLNPFRDFSMVARLVAVYRREKPAIVHHVAMKPVLYGTIAARIARVPAVVNALAGMGWLFTSDGFVSGLLRPGIRRALAGALRRGLVIVQNPDDVAMMQELGVPPGAVRIVPGSGVDLTVFANRPEPEGRCRVVLPARLLWDKGVGDFVDAARRLLARGVPATFMLAGEPDPENPRSISAAQIESWTREGVVDAIGWVENMSALLAGVHVVCLPSLREGLPKALIEAAAAGRAIVTTDVPGCREVVSNGANGFVVPPRNPAALADALEKLIRDPVLRQRMGACGRARAEERFGLQGVISQTLALYREAIG